MARTVLTPGIVCAFAASNDFSVPPNTGHCAMAAKRMPGGRTSTPKIAVPSVFEGMSIRGCDVPSIRNCAGVFSATSRGTGR